MYYIFGHISYSLLVFDFLLSLSSLSFPMPHFFLSLFFTVIDVLPNHSNKPHMSTVISITTIVAILDSIPTFATDINEDDAVQYCTINNLFLYFHSRYAHNCHLLIPLFILVHPTCTVQDRTALYLHSLTWSSNLHRFRIGRPFSKN